MAARSILDKAAALCATLLLQSSSSYAWYAGGENGTGLPIVDLGYQLQQASGFNVSPVSFLSNIIYLLLLSLCEATTPLLSAAACYCVRQIRILKTCQKLMEQTIGLRKLLQFLQYSVCSASYRGATICPASGA
jgi:hypothetical protein